MKDKQYWEKMRQEWEASGLTQLAFCKQRGINYSTFKNWRPATKQDEKFVCDFTKVSPATTSRVKPLVELVLKSGTHIRIFDHDGA